MVSGGRGLNTGILDSVEKQMSVLWLKDGPTSSATRWMWSHEEGLGRHCDWEKKCPEGARETEKGLETRRLNPEGN